MRMKVRAIEPSADDAGLEELVAEPAPDPERSERGHPDRTAAPAAGSPPDADVRLVTRSRPVTAADLGPNGGDVMDLLERASTLTPAERRLLEKEAAWRWWMMNPLAGATMPAARARALVLGRADGRSEAIVALEAAVVAIVARAAGAKAGRSRLPACISNAGLAILVRDIIEPETFATLSGPWREVMRD